MNDRVITAIDNHVATVTLNRADKRNAVDFQMFEALAESAAALGRDNTVRAVVLHGAGSDFCSGLDVSIFAANGIGAAGGDLMQPRSAAGANFFQNAAMCWRELPVPVIAALHGAAFGAGLQIAMGADIRIAAPDTRMSIMEIKWGLIPDMAITATLPGVVAQDRACELAYTGRVVEAAEALRIGLLTELADNPLAKATAVATDIAGRSPDAIRAIKALITASWRDHPAAGLRCEAALQTAVLAGSNQLEAVAANLQRRTPEFRDVE